MLIMPKMFIQAYYLVHIQTNLPIYFPDSTALQTLAQPPHRFPPPPCRWKLILRSFVRYNAVSTQVS